MLRILIVRSKNESKHIVSYTTEKHLGQFPVYCESELATEEIRTIISTLQNYISTEASHAIISLTNE